MMNLGEKSGRQLIRYCHYSASIQGLQDFPLLFSFTQWGCHIFPVPFRCLRRGLGECSRPSHYVKFYKVMADNIAFPADS